MISYIHIIILSCGGAYVVQEALEVQITANSTRYHACAWVCFGYDNAFSLYRCYLRQVFVYIVVSPLLLLIAGSAFQSVDRGVRMLSFRFFLFCFCVALFF